MHRSSPRYSEKTEEKVHTVVLKVSHASGLPDSVGVGWGLRMFVSIKFPGDADAVPAGLRTADLHEAWKHEVTARVWGTVSNSVLLESEGSE